MGKEYDYNDNLNDKILFDLRQTYALKLLEPILLQIELYREQNDFINWYDKLSCALFININQKLTPEERKEYQNKKDNTLKILNAYPYSFRGIDKDIQKFHIVKEAIIKLEIWMREKMEEHGLFGKGNEYDWDEI